MSKKPGPLSEHPFELLFGLLAFLAGLALTLGAVAPTSLNATLPVIVVRAWGVSQLLAGTFMVVGIVIRYWRPALFVYGLRVERAGLVPLSAACAVYGIVAIGYAGVRALYPAGVLAAVAIACLARTRAVAHLEQTIRRHSAGGSSGD